MAIEWAGYASHNRKDDVTVHPKKVCPQMPKVHPQRSRVEMADVDVEMVDINRAESSTNAGITSTAMMLSMTSTTLPKVGPLRIQLPLPNNRSPPTSAGL